jgi:hypothetical protein
LITQLHGSSSTYSISGCPVNMEDVSINGMEVEKVQAHIFRGAGNEALQVPNTRCVICGW